MGSDQGIPQGGFAPAWWGPAAIVRAGAARLDATRSSLAGDARRPEAVSRRELVGERARTTSVHETSGGTYTWNRGEKYTCAPLCDDSNRTRTPRFYPSSPGDPSPQASLPQHLARQPEQRLIRPSRPDQRQPDGRAVDDPAGAVICGKPAIPAAVVSASCRSRYACTTSAVESRANGGPGVVGSISTVPFATMASILAVILPRVSAAAAASAADTLDAPSNRSRTPGPNVDIAPEDSTQGPNSRHTSLVCATRKDSHHFIRGGSRPPTPSPPNRADEGDANAASREASEATRAADVAAADAASQISNASLAVTLATKRKESSISARSRSDDGPDAPSRSASPAARSAGLGGEQTDDVEGRRQRDAPRETDSSVGGSETEDAAVPRGDADAARGVRAEGDVAESRGDGDGGGPTTTRPGRATRRGWILRGAVVRVFARERPRELVHLGLPDERGAGVEEGGDGGGVRGGGVGVGLEPAGIAAPGGESENVQVVLGGEGEAGERA